MMKDEELNQILDIIDRDNSGHKPIPYVGWFWNSIDFTQPISMAVIPKGVIHTNYHYIGIVFENLWNYPQYVLSVEESADFRILIEEYVICNSHSNSMKIRNFLTETLQQRTAILSLCEQWKKKPFK